MRVPPLCFFLSLTLLTGPAWAQTPTLMVQSGHTQFAEDIALSPDGRFAVTGALDRTAILWHLETGREVRVFSRGLGPVTSVAFSGNGKLVYTGDDRGGIQAWDPSTGLSVAAWKPESYPKKLLPAPNGTDLFVLTASGRLIRLDTNRGSVEHVDENTFYRKAALSPDGTRLLAATTSGTLVLLDSNTGEVVTAFAGHPGLTVTAAAISPDGMEGLSAGYDGLLRRWNLATGAEIARYEVQKPRNPIEATYDRFGSRALVVASGLQTWDLKSGTKERTTPVSMVTEALPTLDGIRAVGAGYAGLEVCRIGGDKEATFGTNRPPLTSVAVTPDTRYLLAGFNRGEYSIWDRFAGKWVRSDSGRDRVSSFAVSPLAISPDGRETAATDWISTKPGHQVIVRRALSDGSVLGRIDTGMSRLKTVLYTKGGQTVLVAGEQLGLWAVSGEPVHRFNIGDSRVLSAALSPDGTKLAAGLSDKTVRLWDLATGEELRQWMTPVLGIAGSEITSVAFVGDSRVLAGLSKGSKPIEGWFGALLWDAETGALVRGFEPSQVSVSAVTGLGDHIFLAVGQDIHLYDLKSGGMSELVGHTGSVVSLVYVESAHALYSGSSDGTSRWWDLSRGNRWVAMLAGDIFNAGTWAVFSEDGYWDGSKDCTSLLGMTKGNETWSIEQFAVRNNRPDLLLDRLGSPDASLRRELALQWANRARSLGLNPSDLSQGGSDPVSRIERTQRVGDELVLNLAFFSPDHALAAYSISVNGVPLPGPTRKISGGSTRLEERVPLSRGDNSISVSCFDVTGKESLNQTVTAFRAGREPGALYFLGVGVSQYEDPAIPDLSFAAKDAADLADLFTTLGQKNGFRVETRVLTDAQATGAAIRDAKNFLSGAGVDDTVIVFVSGHGLQWAPKDSTQQPSFAYVPTDARLTSPERTLVGLAQLEGLLEGPSRKRLLVIDACQSGTLAEGSEQSPGGRARTIAPEVVAALVPGRSRAWVDTARWIYHDLTYRTGTVVMNSSRGDEASFESKIWGGHGAFTAAFLGAFQDPAADANRNGKIDRRELERYLGLNVPFLTGNRQHPTVDRDNPWMEIELPRL